MSPVGNLIASPEIDFVIRTVQVGGKNLTFYEVLTPFADIKVDKTPTTPISSENSKKSIDDLKIHSRSVKRSFSYSERITLRQASSNARRFRGTDGSLGRVLALGPRMKRKDWLTLLGDHWPACGHTWLHVEGLRHRLGPAGPHLPMMDSDEKAAYAALPQHLMVFRGCSSRYLDGASWSLDPDVAREFGTDTHSVPDPVLLTAIVRKQDVLALKGCDVEQEVITFRSRRVAIEPNGGYAAIAA